MPGDAGGVCTRASENGRSAWLGPSVGSLSESIKGAKALWRQQKIYTLDWVAFGRCMDALLFQISAASFRPSTIVAVARGGLVPAIHLANALDCTDFRIIGVARNVSNGLYSEKQEPAYRWISPAAEFHGGSVLLVDDIVGAGATLALAIDVLHAGGVQVVQSAAVVRNCNSMLRPDYCVAIVDDWVVFPWEKTKYDASRVSVPVECAVGLE